ncbi:RagB/SusD family nutrient uptake outer membrane protein [Polaribacter butkevichii]|uniref:RagB/SusD family nutrient uptake outer membrane protein n=1 Tax=Polaribacter butkevichii TaxID=218490 RepID=A0A2P6CB99_9FLAO|nr:RagB/SusD family nutrient uptake outer membrane protein [Polaribacter butkevichii]PQJ72180.1 hypothetical protein BTO14_02465 [Polaribacter butkevichii]
MKNYQNIIIVFILTFSIYSCELVNVTDIEAQDVLTEETAITDQIGAELALAGTYSTLNDGNLAVTGINIYPFYIDTDPKGSSNGYSTNNVDSENGTIALVYSSYYNLINRANYVINIVPELEDNLFEPGKKNHIVAEAKFLRSVMSLYLLRRFGQFWDLESPYGIVLREKQASTLEVLPRSSVQASYDFILSDLDYAIENLPASNVSYHANKFAAKGLKSRVLLYMGKFSEAATLANDVILNSGFTLENTFAEVFENEFNSSEVLFSNIHSDTEYNGTSVGWWLYLSLSEYYVNFATSQGDTRLDIVNFEHPTRGYLNGKAPFFFDGATNYYLRLPEVYLIYAEALARSNGSLIDVAAAVNTVRNRAGLLNTTASTREELIEAIRVEKFLELVAEEQEPWFDLVRYADLDGFDISTIKPLVTSKNQYILPIPFNSVTTSNNVVEQNPGY